MQKGSIRKHSTKLEPSSLLWERGSESSVVVIDGGKQPQRSVEVSLDGLGFAYGYGVFETIKCMQGRAVFLAEHCRRLLDALNELGLAATETEASLSEQVRTVLANAEKNVAVLKIAAFEDDARTRFALFTRSARAVSSPPLGLTLSPVVRASQAFSSRHKTLNYLENYRALQRARKNGYDDAFFLNEMGHVTETSVANLFFLRGEAVRTPALDNGLLNGVIRAKVMEICQTCGMDLREGAYSLGDLEGMDGVFVTNSSVGLMEVAEMRAGDRKYSFGTGSPVVRRLRAGLTALEASSIR